MPMNLLGIGTAVPRHRIAQADSARMARPMSCQNPVHDALLDRIYQRSSVRYRHSVLLDRSDGEIDSRQNFFGSRNPSTLDRMRRYEAEADSLAHAAAEQAIAAAGIAPGRITHLITVSCTGFHAPGFDLALLARLRLGPDVARTHIGFMGCHGVLNGMRVAQAFVEADPGATVLLCAVELCSLHLQYGWEPERIVANALFADGAGCFVATGGHPADGAQVPFRLRASGSTVIAGTAEAMSWRIADHGFVMTLSAQVPAIIGANLGPWLKAWLARHGLSLAAVGSWAVHPGGPRILSAVQEAVGLDGEQIAASASVLQDYGNMSSATILFILDRLRLCGAPRPCVALAFGPGLCVEAALLE